MGQFRPLFVYFRYFIITISIIQIEERVDGVLGIRTRGGRMVCADKTMDLWQPPFSFFTNVICTQSLYNFNLIKGEQRLYTSGHLGVLIDDIIEFLILAFLVFVLKLQAESSVTPLISNKNYINDLPSL